MNNRRPLLYCLVSLSLALPLTGQEAGAGFELRATLTGLAAASSVFTEAPRSGAPVNAGFRSVFYPVWKINEHWTISGAWQLNSRPYFMESFSTQGYGATGSLLQGTLNYSRTSGNRSIVVRAGQMTTAFGSFLLHYDDTDNALIGLPPQYGYYYQPISSLSLAGAQVDVSAGRWDGRLQIANSSPSNPRSIFAHDQYANWTGGAGYSIRQGFRIGVSAQRGPYLDRQLPFFRPGEANPVDLPSSALGVDAQFARGHWSLEGEWQRFVKPYKVVPTFRERAGYVEFKRVLNPRIYIAGRVGYLGKGSRGVERESEAAVGYRPSANQLLKFSYLYTRAGSATDQNENTLAVQFVTTIRPLSFARK